MEGNHLRRWPGLLFVSSLMVVGCRGQRSDHQALERALRARYSSTATFQVGFLRDSTHLLIHIVDDSSSESAFTTKAREIARFAMGKYERAARLDSITVVEGEMVSPNSHFRIRQQLQLAATDAR